MMTQSHSEKPSRTHLAHGCIIMASGQGTRFGGNKLMAKLDGMPLVAHVMRATSELFDERIVVTRHAEVAKLCRAAGVDVVMHNEPERNDTVRLGMEALGSCDTVTFFQADQPLISTSSITALLQAAEREPDCIWRASFQGTPGAPVLFPAWAFTELRALPAGKGGGFVAKAHPERVRYVEVASSWELFDVDTPDDLQILAQHVKQER